MTEGGDKQRYGEMRPFGWCEGARLVAKAIATNSTVWSKSASSNSNGGQGRPAKSEVLPQCLEDTERHSTHLSEPPF